MDLRLDNARISFASGLWNPSAAVETGTKKYNADFIISPDTKVLRKDTSGKWVPTTIQQAEQQVVLEAFKGNKAQAKAWFDKLERSKRSVREGNLQTTKDGEVRDGYADCMYVHATSTKRMPVYRGDRTVVDSEADSPIFSGCYVNARVSLYVNLKSGKQGVFAGLEGTQYYRSGDAIGGAGRAASADDFDEVDEGADAGDFGDEALA